MGKGRPRKTAKRTPSGQISRAGKTPSRTAGNDKAVERARRFRSNGHDPIGRAFETGLLGSGDDGRPSLVARVRLDVARALYRAYWPMLGVGRVKCTLGESAGSSGQGNIKSERWLKRQMSIVGPMGSDERTAFDELVLDGHFDEGPDWLDRMICKQARESDARKLKMAIAVIDRLAKKS